MNYSEKDTDAVIRSYLADKKMSLPGAYTNLVKNQVAFYCEEYNGRGKKLFGNSLPKAAAAFFVICAAAAAAGGAYAAINYVQHRMQSLSEEEKTEFAREARYANADSFSRDLSGQEKIRLDILLDRYESEGIFPEYEVYTVEAPGEVLPDRVCFFPETSTFYLPAEPMNDEQLLEIIDFYFKREYSLASQDITTEYQQVAEISEEEAVRLAGEKLENVYGIDTEGLTVQVEYKQELDGRSHTFTTDYITFSSGDSSEYYLASVNLQSGEVNLLHYGDDAEPDYSESFAADTELFQELYDSAKIQAAAYLGSPEALTAGGFEYLAGENKLLDTGIVNYVFQTTENEYCVVSYGCARNCFYQVRSFTEGEQKAREQRNTELAKSRNLEYVRVAMEPK